MNMSVTIGSISAALLGEEKSTANVRLRWDAGRVLRSKRGH